MHAYLHRIGIGANHGLRRYHRLVSIRRTRQVAAVNVAAGVIVWVIPECQGYAAAVIAFGECLRLGPCLCHGMALLRRGLKQAVVEKLRSAGERRRIGCVLQFAANAGDVAQVHGHRDEKHENYQHEGRQRGDSAGSRPVGWTVQADHG